MLAVEHGQQAGQAVLDRGGLQQGLPFLEAEVQVDGDEVGEMAGVFGVERGNFDLLGKGGGKLDDLLELALRVAHHGRQFHRVLGDVLDQLEAGGKVRLGRGVFGDSDAPQSLDEHADGAVGELEHFQDAGGAADVMHFMGLRVFGIRVALEGNAEQALAGHDIVNELDALGGLDEQGGDHAREHDDVREAQDGQAFGKGPGGNARGRLRAAGSSEDADKFCVGRSHGNAFHQIRCPAPDLVQIIVGLPSAIGTRVLLDVCWARGTSIRRKPLR